MYLLYQIIGRINSSREKLLFFIWFKLSQSKLKVWNIGKVIDRVERDHRWPMEWCMKYTPYPHNDKSIWRKQEKLNCLSASLTKSQKNNDGNKWMNHGNSSLFILFLSLDISPNTLHISLVSVKRQLWVRVT